MTYNPDEKVVWRSPSCGVVADCEIVVTYEDTDRAPSALVYVLRSYHKDVATGSRQHVLLSYLKPALGPVLLEEP